MKEKDFYRMLSKIHNEIADMSCGCMGYGYTPERVERDDKNDSDFNRPQGEDEAGHTIPTYVPSERPLDYLGNVIRRYIRIDNDEVVYEQEDPRLTALLKACNEFKIWYMTLASMNPERFIKLKEILPNAIINNLEQAIQKAELEE